MSTNLTLSKNQPPLTPILCSLQPPPPPPPADNHHQCNHSTTVNHHHIAFFNNNNHMKISSKSILSPGRAMAREPPNSLSTSLSRRLRTSGSIKGGASPAMFPTAARKRTFENPEPSSPKVTCIGQVRVRGKKKQAKKLRTLSRRHSSGEVSFRTLDHPLNGFHSKDHNHQESSNLGPNGSRNQIQECSPVQRSWVHFPVTICEALRAFGSEFSCLIPCRTERGKEEKTVAAGDDHRGGSCGAVFTRWLVAVQDGDGGGGKDIELVIGDEEDEDEDEEESVVRRRHVFEDLEIVDGRIGGDNDEGRVSVCVPPKNALLLMRCRSDPMKVEALSSGSWEPSGSRYEEEDEEFVDCENQIEKDQENVVEADKDQEQQNVQLDEANHDQEDDNVLQDDANQDQELDNVQENEVNQDQELDNVQVDEANEDQEHDNMQEDEANLDQEHDNVQQIEVSQDQEHDNLQEDEVGQDQEHEQTETEEESFHLASLFEETINQDYQIQEHDEANEVAETENSTMATKFTEISKTHEEEEEVLPDCLLMMMHEPKLSINVSKETWVCSKDFIKLPTAPTKRKPPPPSLPPPPPVKPDGGLTAALPQPARSSCSLPVAPSMATVLEQKLANAVGYEPFVLTRCKSEPMKTAASKLLPESCVWENRRLERLSGVGFGVGAAGLGF